MPKAHIWSSSCSLQVEGNALVSRQTGWSARTNSGKLLHSGELVLLNINRSARHQLFYGNLAVELQSNLQIISPIPLLKIFYGQYLPSRFSLNFRSISSLQSEVHLWIFESGSKHSLPPFCHPKLWRFHPKSSVFPSPHCVRFQPPNQQLHADIVSKEQCGLEVL